MNKTAINIIFAVAIAATIYYNGMNHPIAKYLSMALFGFLFVLALFQTPRKQRPIVFMRWEVWFVLACVVNFLLAFDKMSFEQLLNFEIAIPLIVAFSSYYLFDVKRENLSLFMLPICLFAAYCSIDAVLSGLGGFHIAEYREAEIAKNQIGAAFTTFAIICGVFMLENKKVVIKIIYGVLSIVCVYPALFFSCRTALLSYFLVLVFLMFREYKWKGLFVVPIVFVLVALVGGEDLWNLLYDSIVGRRDVSDFDDLSAGRLTHASQSLEYFLQHPLLGFYGSGDEFNVMPRNAHIFLLYRLTKWGIIGAIPFIALYVSVFKVFISSLRTNDLLLAGVLLLAFVESFSEYAPPFGPGSCFIISFILIGYYLRSESS